MSRFFRGNYGSNLGSTANAANLIARAGEAQGQMYANLGQQIGGIIKQYGLNKEKRNKLQSTLEGQLSADPSIVQQLTMTGDEQYDKKNMKLFDKVQSGDASIADLERANGLLSGKTTQENAMLKKQNAETQQRMNELNLEVTEMLKDPMVSDAIGRYELNKVNRASQKKTIPSDTEVRLKTNESKLKTIPGQTDATMSANNATAIKGDIIVADAMSRGGPLGVAKELKIDRELNRRGTEADIRSKDTLSNYRNKSIELLEGRSNLPQGSGNEEIETSIKGIDTEIDRIMKGQTFSKDSDGNTLSYSDLIADINPITGEVTLSEDASNYASRDIARLKELIQGKMQLRLSQTVKVPNVDGVMIEVTYADIEEQKAKRRMQQAEIQSAVRSAPSAFPMPDYH
jgi:hypothetical protein